MTSQAADAGRTGLAAARAVADAVLFEGYALYPYRASSAKNQVRFQWGVLMPADVVEADPSERDHHRAELVVEGRRAGLRLVVRFLQIQRREVHAADDSGPVARLAVGDTVHVPWDEAVEREVEVDVPLADEGTREHLVAVPGGEDVEDLPDAAGGLAGRLVRRREPLRVEVRVEVRRPPSPYGVALVAATTTNRTGAAADPAAAGAGSAPTAAARAVGLRRALVAAHVLAEVDDGAFVSQLDPPEWARGFVSACTQEGVFPVLLGDAGQPEGRRMTLASPIILYDHPSLAPESEASFFDGLEVDELLSLRTMTLSEEEKQEMRGTDPRTAALLAQVDSMPADLWDRLHGTIRYLDTMTGQQERRAPGPPPVADDVPWFDPGSDASVDPETDSVLVGGVPVARGTRVVLRPGARRADAYDMFLAGREAHVAAVFHDVDGHRHLAVTVDDDPGSDLKSSHGRYLYFAPDELEPLAGPGGPP